jgi:hypothetical protein
MPNQPVVFEDVVITRRGAFTFQCRVAGQFVWIGSLQPQPGSDITTGGHRLVLRRLDAARLGLIDWKPPD